jgi:hypothetical protein
MFTTRRLSCLTTTRVAPWSALFGLSAVPFACSDPSSIPTDKTTSGNGGIQATAAAASSGALDAGTTETDVEAGAPSDVPSDAPSDAGMAVDISGDWAMFAFADPVAVSIAQHGGELTGTGCCGGLPSESATLDCCSPLGGSIHGRRMNFTFAVELASSAYAADAFVSADGTRMAGAFHGASGWLDEPTAWLRLDPGQVWLSGPDETALTALEAHAGSYALRLQGEVSVGIYTPGQRYSLHVVGRRPETMVYGALGAFWHTELTWNEAAQTLTAGPVPQTDPRLPIELELRFENETLANVTALLPSDEVATFSVGAP